MTDEVKVSIVVPVYNAEKTLKRCVDSIIQQSYTNWELLLIDDGSIDGSKIICDEYCQKDSRVVYFYKRNGGASSARNYGIAKATGQYIMFIDSDDWIESETVEKLLLEAISSQAEYIIPRMRIKIYNSDKCIEERYDNDEEPFRCSQATIATDFLSIMQKGILFSASGRLYLVKFLKEKEILFSEKIKLLEDFCFNLTCLNQGASISHISFIAYNFYVKDISRYVFKRRYDDYYSGINEAYMRLKAFLISRKINDDIYYNNFFINYWVLALKAVEEQEKNSFKRYRFQKKIAVAVSLSGIMEDYSENLINRSVKCLFITREPILYHIMLFLQELKKHYMKLTSGHNTKN